MIISIPVNILYITNSIFYILVCIFCIPPKYKLPGRAIPNIILFTEPANPNMNHFPIQAIPNMTPALYF